jgi:hypothetical protein
MLMIIFGAGASCDSFPSRPPPPPTSITDFEERPPLASQLFADRGHFRNVAKNYPKCLPLIGELEPRSGAGLSVEEVLEQYQSLEDGEAQSQLWAIRYYLRTVITYCQTEWTKTTRGVSNYSGLFNQARRLGRVCFVTFNYDTLLEQALAQFDIQFPSLERYVDNPSCALLKLHGSTDWVYWIRKLGTKMQHNTQPPDNELIRAAPPIDPTTTLLRKIGDTPREASGEIYFEVPALAIPVVSKSEFVCPSSHIAALCALLPQVTHIAAIGWRAAENHFLVLLGRHLPKDVAVTSVCGNETESKEILGRIGAAGVSGRFSPVPETFTDFVRIHGIESFMR